MKAVLIGYGEVGKGLYEAFGIDHDIKIQDTVLGLVAKEKPYDIMLVAIPYNSYFEEVVRGYQYKFSPKAVVVFSTVPVGTCKKIGAVHSPIEAHHENMAQYIRIGKRWIGGSNPIVTAFFELAGCIITQMPEPDHTEFLKLRSTTIYGINIEFARYSAIVAEMIGFDIEAIEKYDMDYNALVDYMGKQKYRRYILNPPIGKIGGHCVLPNAKILQEQYPHPFIQTVLDFNEDED